MRFASVCAGAKALAKKNQKLTNFIRYALFHPRWYKISREKFRGNPKGFGFFHPQRSCRGNTSASRQATSTLAALSIIATFWVCLLLYLGLFLVWFLFSAVLLFVLYKQKLRRLPSARMAHALAHASQARRRIPMAMVLPPSTFFAAFVANVDSMGKNVNPDMLARLDVHARTVLEEVLDRQRAAGDHRGISAHPFITTRILQLMHICVPFMFFFDTAFARGARDSLIPWDRLLSHKKELVRMLGVRVPCVTFGEVHHATEGCQALRDHIEHELLKFAAHVHRHRFLHEKRDTFDMAAWRQIAWLQFEDEEHGSKRVAATISNILTAGDGVMNSAVDHARMRSALDSVQLRLAYGETVDELDEDAVVLDDCRRVLRNTYGAVVELFEDMIVFWKLPDLSIPALNTGVYGSAATWLRHPLHFAYARRLQKRLEFAVGSPAYLRLTDTALWWCALELGRRLGHNHDVVAMVLRAHFPRLRHAPVS